MSSLKSRGSFFRRTAGITALAATGLVVALPAAAQDNAAEPAGSNSQPAASNSAASTAENASATGANPQRPANGMNGMPQQPRGGQNPRPSQQLPEPKSSDYGASSYHAPSDAELDRFAATHQPPPDNGDQSTDKPVPQNGSNPALGPDSADDSDTPPAIDQSGGMDASPDN